MTLPVLPGGSLPFVEIELGVLYAQDSISLVNARPTALGIDAGPILLMELQTSA
jgi:hypothetical protein